MEIKGIQIIGMSPTAPPCSAESFGATLHKFYGTMSADYLTTDHLTSCLSLPEIAFIGQLTGNGIGRWKVEYHPYTYIIGRDYPGEPAYIVTRRHKDDLTFRHFQEASTRRGWKAFKHMRDFSDWDESKWSNALAGETGEACNLIKKRDRGEEISVDAVGKEIGDVVAYAALLATKLGLDFEQIVRDKFNEVSDRKDCGIKI